MSCLVVPVSMSDAMDWCRGRIGDVDLIVRCPLQGGEKGDGEGILVASIAGRAGLRTLLLYRAAWPWIQFAIFRTDSPRLKTRGMAHHLEASGQIRYMLRLDQSNRNTT